MSVKVSRDEDKIRELNNRGGGWEKEVRNFRLNALIDSNLQNNNKKNVFIFGLRFFILIIFFLFNIEKKRM